MTTQTVKVTGLQSALDSLTIFQRSRIPGSIAWSLNKFGFILRENEQKVITQTFNRSNAFTRNAPLFTKPTKENPRLRFFLRDNAPRGNSPDRYLLPQVEGGDVYVTRFTRALRIAGAIEGSEYIFHWGNPKYKPTPGFISALTTALATGAGPVRSGAQYRRNLKASDRYFILDKAKASETRSATVSNRKYVDDGYQGPGIYTRKGKKLDLIYRILKNTPRVPRKYDWSEGRMQRLADEHLPKLLLDKLAEF